MCVCVCDKHTHTHTHTHTQEEGAEAVFELARLKNKFQAVEADQKLANSKQQGLTYGAKYKCSQAIVYLGALLAVCGGAVSLLEAFTNMLD